MAEVKAADIAAQLEVLKAAASDALDEDKVERYGDALEKLRDASGDAFDAKQAQVFQEVAEDTQKILEEQTLEFQKQNDEIGKLIAVFGTLGTIASGVAKASPATMQRFTLAMSDLSAVIGQIFIPVIDRATTAIRAMADWIINLPQPLKNFIANFATLGVAITSVSLILPKVIGAFGGLLAIISKVKAATMALGLGMGGFAIVLTALVPMLASVLSESGGLQAIFDALKPAVSALSNAIGKLFGALAPIIELLAEIGTIIIEAVAPIIEVLAVVIAAVVEVLAALLDITKPLIEMFKETFLPIIREIGQEFAAVVTEVARFIIEILRLLGFLDQVEKKRKSSVGASARQIDFIDAKELQKRAITASLTATLGKKTREEQTAKNIEEIRNNTNHLGALAKDVGEIIKFVKGLVSAPGTNPRAQNAAGALPSFLAIPNSLLSGTAFF